MGEDGALCASWRGCEKVVTTRHKTFCFFAMDHDFLPAEASGILDDELLRFDEDAAVEQDTLSESEDMLWDTAMEDPLDEETQVAETITKQEEHFCQMLYFNIEEDLHLDYILDDNSYEALDEGVELDDLLQIEDDDDGHPAFQLDGADVHNDFNLEIEDDMDDFGLEEEESCKQIGSEMETTAGARRYARSLP